MMSEDNIYYFSLGRNAIYAVFKILDIGIGDEVLTPAWDCDGTLEPFWVVGCTPVFYRCDPFTFDVDLDHIRSLVTEKTKLIHIINQFGQPQPWEKILAVRDEINIPILEDNAYSFLSGINNKKFGDFGDFSIFSLRKNLPIPDGGLLKINCAQEYKSVSKHARWLYPPEYKTAINILVNKIKYGFGIERKSLFGFLRKKEVSGNYLIPLYSDGRKEPPHCERNVIQKDFAFDYARPMSKLSKLMLKYYTKSKLQYIADLKRKYYELLVSELTEINGIQILRPELQDGVVPYCVNILVEKNRDEILKLLLAKRYPVMAWPTLPTQILSNLKNYPEVEVLGRKLLQINLKPELKINMYDQLCSDLKLLLNR
jgi:dTDP-4-amino-4,6-dideoxygalactose transaminase